MKVGAHHLGGVDISDLDPKDDANWFVLHPDRQFHARVTPNGWV
jgi:hypothetical protein